MIWSGIITKSIFTDYWILTWVRVITIWSCSMLLSSFCPSLKGFPAATAEFYVEVCSLLWVVGWRWGTDVVLSDWKFCLFWSVNAAETWLTFRDLLSSLRSLASLMTPAVAYDSEDTTICYVYCSLTTSISGLDVPIFSPLLALSTLSS